MASKMSAFLFLSFVLVSQVGCEYKFFPSNVIWYKRCCGLVCCFVCIPLVPHPKKFKQAEFDNDFCLQDTQGVYYKLSFNHWCAFNSSVALCTPCTASEHILILLLPLSHALSLSLSSTCLLLPPSLPVSHPTLYHSPLSSHPLYLSALPLPRTGMWQVPESQRLGEEERSQRSLPLRHVYLSLLCLHRPPSGAHETPAEGQEVGGVFVLWFPLFCSPSFSLPSPRLSLSRLLFLSFFLFCFVVRSYVSCLWLPLLLFLSFSFFVCVCLSVSLSSKFSNVLYLYLKQMCFCLTPFGLINLLNK